MSTDEDLVSKTRNIRFGLTDFMESMKPIWGFLRLVKRKLEEGKWLVFVDEKLLDWVDRRIEAGVYQGRTHAVESLIREKMKEEKE